MANERSRVDATVRRYELDDLDACRALWVELTRWHRDLYESLEIGGSDPGHLFDEHLQRVGRENVWVAEVAGRVIGLTGLIPGDREPELEPLVVLEQYRGSGVGRRLVEAVIDKARAEGAHFLRVRPTARNRLALSVFRELGFDILGHIELLMDFRPKDRGNWQPGERIAGLNFRV